MIDLSMQCGRALVALQAAGRIRVAFLPGMLLHEVATPGAALWRGPCRLTEEGGEGGGVWRPDLTDVATVGCLAALFREAKGHQGWHACPPRPVGSGKWFVEIAESDKGWHYAGDTEGEAWAQGLISLAGVP